MNKSRAVIAISAAAILGIAVAVLLRKPPSETAPRGPADSPAERAGPAADASAAREPAAAPQPVVPTGPVAKEPDRVRVRADNILATVNGMAVQGRDLLVFGAAANPEQDLSPEIYEALLNRAIERELILQAARSGGLELQPDQEAQLDQVRKTVLAREGGDPDAKFMNVQGTLEEQLAFELRDARAMLLRNNLVAQQGHPLPFVNAEQVKAYYDAHAGDYDPLPEDPAERQAAWQKIDYQIRSTLAPQLQAEYQGHVDAYMQALKTGARIER